MSRSSLHPLVPDHGQHDALLVAQFAAGDALDPSQQEEVHTLVAGCDACSALAADLRAVSGAVAREPTPPRRRDLRISQAQADEARGGLLARSMRRLAMPMRAGTLRPAAAGMMSLGLLFMVAGAVWPSGSDVATDSRPAAVPQAGNEDISTPLPDVEAFVEDVDAESGSASRARSEAEPAVDDLFGADTVADENRQKTTQDAGVGADVGASDPDQPEAAEMLQQFAAEPAPNGAEESELADRSSASVPATAAAADTRVADVQGVDEVPAERAELDVTGAEAGIEVPMILLVLGAGLAVGGVLLLLLMWLTRRSADPLLR